MTRLLFPTLALAVVVTLGSGPAMAVAEPPPTTAIDNEFVPENQDLTECISAVPRPGCGDESRSGWRQGLVLVALVGGLGFIGWRIRVASARRSVRRNEPDAADPRGQNR